MQCKVKMTGLFYLFQSTGGSWTRKKFQIVKNSVGNYLVKCYKESFGHSSL